jgi:hypothetical protein
MSEYPVFLLRLELPFSARQLTRRVKMGVEVLFFLMTGVWSNGRESGV